MVQHLTNLYAAEHTGVETFILTSGSVYTWLFWVGQVGIGGLVPMALLAKYRDTLCKFKISLASAMVIIGGLAQMYVIIIGGQAYPLVLFPGMEVESSFFDGVINAYTPSLPEIGLGLGGTALAVLIVLVGMRVLRFLPVSLADADIDPHFKAAE